MRKSGKLLIGVLSVGALVGTGYATWHINGGFVGEKDVEVGTEVNVEVFRPFASITVAQKDTNEKIVFDGKADEHLTKTYTIKANKGTGEYDKDPYDLSTYTTLADEYKPNLHVHTYAYKAGQLLDEKDPFFNYVVMPQTIDINYETWLDAKYKETGYEHTLAFSWSEETLKGLNPEDAWKDLTADEQASNYKALIDALDGVTFKLDFVVGQKDYIAPTAPVTGEVTIPTIEGTELKIAGLKEGKLDAGTHDVEIDLTNENTAIKNNELIVHEAIDGQTTDHKVTLTQKTTRAITRTYTAKFNFKEKATYTFSYEVIKVGTIKVTNNENVTVNVKVGDKAYDNTELVENTVATIEANAKEGYRLGEVKVNGTALTGKNGVYTFNVVAGMNEVTTTATQITGKIVTEADEFTTIKYKVGGEYVTNLDALALNTEVTVEATPAKDYKLETLTHNGTSILDTKTFLVKEGNNLIKATSVKEVIEPEVKFGQIVYEEVKGLTLEFKNAEGTPVELNKDVQEGTKVNVTATLLENYELKTLTHNGTDILETKTFTVVAGTNTVIATVEEKTPVTDPYANPVEASALDVVNEETRSSTYFKITAVVKQHDGKSFVLTDKNNPTVDLNMNRLYKDNATLRSLINYADGKYNYKDSDNIPSDDFTDVFKVGDEIVVYGVTNSTGWVKASFDKIVTLAENINYKVNVTQEGGQVTLSKENAPIGTAIDLTVTPPEGKAINSVTLDGNLIEATAEGKYTFTSTFTNNIEITYRDASLVVYDPVVITKEAFPSATSGSYTTYTDGLVTAKGTNLPDQDIKLSGRFAVNTGDFQVNKDKGIYFANQDALPSGIKGIDLSLKDMSRATNFTCVLSNERLDSTTIANSGLTVLKFDATGKLDLSSVQGEFTYFRIEYNTGNAAYIHNMMISF